MWVPVLVGYYRGSDRRQHACSVSYGVLCIVQYEVLIRYGKHTTGLPILQSPELNEPLISINFPGGSISLQR